MSAFTPSIAWPVILPPPPYLLWREGFWGLSLWHTSQSQPHLLEVAILGQNVSNTHVRHNDE